MSKPEFAVNLLDRLHTLIVIASGATVGVVMMTVLPHRPDAADKGFTALLIALALAYATSFAVDVLVTYTVSPVRARLRAQADQLAIAPARTED